MRKAAEKRRDDGFDAVPGRYPLPTLHRSVARAFVRVVLAFGCLGGLLMLGVFFASRLPDQLVRMNYESVVYVRQMEEAVNGLRFPALYGETPEHWRTAFQEALEREQGNITEHDEQAVVDELRAAWSRFDAVSTGP